VLADDASWILDIRPGFGVYAGSPAPPALPSADRAARAHRPFALELATFAAADNPTTCEALRTQTRSSAL
jgi:hypothetical protein